METKKLDPKILYLSFHNSLKKVYNHRVVTKNEIFTKLGRQFLVPKCLREVAVRELKEMKLIEEIEKDTFKILEPKLNIEEDANIFLHNIGLFLVTI